jgi:hypothetical protein
MEPCGIFEDSFDFFSGLSEKDKSDVTFYINTRYLQLSVMDIWAICEQNIYIQVFINCIFATTMLSVIYIHVIISKSWKIKIR